MNNAEMIALAAQKNIQNITTHKVPAEHSYKIVRFKSAFNKRLKEYDDARAAVVKEAGIDDEAKFEKEYEELKGKSKLTEKQKEWLGKMKEIMTKRDEMVTKLLNEDVTLENVKTMPYEVWKVLQDENCATDKRPEMLSGVLMVIESIGADGEMKFRKEDTEEVLEGVLWVPPTE